MRLARVGEILELQRRQVLVDPTAEYYEIGIRSFGRGVFHKPPIRGIDLGNKRVFEIRPGDLLLSNVFAWEGAVALATEADRGRIGSHRFMTYTPRDEATDTSYLRYYFVSERGVEQLGLASPGSAGRNRTLAVERFEAIEVPLPHIDEQRRIASQLDRTASAAELLENKRTITRTRVEALYASMAGQHHLSEPTRRRRGWRPLTLADVMRESDESVNVKIGKTYANLGILSFGRGVFEKPPIDGLETSAKTLRRVRSGQFIYSRLFAFEGAYASVPARFDSYYVSNEFPTFDVDPNYASAEFIAAALRSPSQWHELASQSKGLGVRRQRIRVDALLAHKLWFPSVGEQQRIVAGLRKLNSAVNLVERSNGLAGALVSSTLNRTFAQLA